jgi:ADP-ribose pyrophosphatase
VTDTVWQGKYLEVRVDGAWEYAARKGDISAAVIVAIDADDHILLVEQHRVPVGRLCLELPAGLVGDETAGESLETAAARELEEETGYRAATIERLGEFCSSPGMTSETFTLVRATGLTRVGDGGGVPGEDITVYRVPIGDVPRFVAEKRVSGVAIDAKMLLLLGAGLI